jgi:hypothetical protein
MTVIESGAIATELADHITHADNKCPGSARRAVGCRGYWSGGLAAGSR